ncbi:hypothetical protein VTK73DRAFT_7097 [Phialemonium thermophilum]|uniref:Uncharacterized protein n=1 Tax=Phialemonium thermophilum TaxID=223376 RepID=A0ABR3XTP4_9PEZI
MWQEEKNPSRSRKSTILGHWMSYLEQQSPVFSQEVRLKKETMSILYSALMPSVQGRLPPEASIRRSMTATDTCSIPILTSPESASTSAYVASQGWEDDIVDSRRSSWALPDSTALQGRYDSASTRPASADRLGVDWMCGQQGVQLIVNARREAGRQSLSGNYNAQFERNTYIDGVSYLLRGLPSDLDKTEAAVLRKSLPAPVVDSPTFAREPAERTSRDAHERSLLRRITKLLVAQLIVWLVFIWPHVVQLLRKLMQFEREHRISENIFGRSISFANTFAKVGMAAALAVCNMCDGKAKDIVADGIAWTVQGVVAGFSDGVEDGWAKIGERRTQERR